MTRPCAALLAFVFLLPLACSADKSSSTNSVVTTDSTVVQTTPLRVVVLGDSIAIPQMGCGSCVGFDRQYAEYLGNATGRSVELSNRARANAGIEDLQAVLDSDLAVQSDLASADVVIVSIGYNSGPPFGADEPCHAPEAVHDIDQLNAILGFTPECVQATLDIRRGQLDAVYARVEALAAGRAQLRVTFGVFNNIKGNPGGDGTFAHFAADDMATVEAILVSLTGEWNTMDCEVATAHEFICADLYHAFNGPDGTESVAAFVSAADFVHPSVVGQAVMFELLKRLPLDVLS